MFRSKERCIFRCMALAIHFFVCDTFLYTKGMEIKAAKGTCFSARPFCSLFCMQQTVSRVLSGMVIYLGRMSPHASSRLFGRCRTSLASRSDVAPSGVYSARMSPYAQVSSYLAFPPLPTKGRRYLSVALSLESPPQAVSLHPCPMEPGLSSCTGLLPMHATI